MTVSSKPIRFTLQIDGQKNGMEHEDETFHAAAFFRLQILDNGVWQPIHFEYDFVEIIAIIYAKFSN